MTLKSLSCLLFPNETRTFYGKRLIKISLRSFHLVGISVLTGGFYYSMPIEGIRLYLWISVISGLGMILVDFICNGVWIIQNRGWMVLLKVILVGNISYFYPQEFYVVIIVIIFSGLLSHAPGNFRYYSIYHKKRIENLM